MLSINTNISSCIAQRSLTNSTQLLNQAIERMTTGYKLNHASDNAANYSISTNQTTKLSAYQIAEDNASMGLDLLTTANDSLNLISDHLTRIRDLAIQAGNGTYGAQSLNAIKAEVNARVDEIKRLYAITEYNGVKLFDGTTADVNPATADLLVKVNPRDTSSMTKLSEVDESTKLTGTYSISTADELAKLSRMGANHLIDNGAEFVLSNDIDLNAYAGNWIPIDMKDEYSVSVKATFDGNGYIISNLTSTEGGLFSRVDTIKNLGLENIDVSGQDVSGMVHTATNIYNCYVTGTVNSINSFNDSSGLLAGVVTTSIEYSYSEGSIRASEKVAGLVGNVGTYTLNGNISHCFSTADVSCPSTAYKTSGSAGGLVVDLFGGKMTDCFATGVVGAGPAHCAGGLVAGLFHGEIRNSYSTGTVYQQRTVTGGSLVGYSVGTIVGCYALSPTYINSTDIGIFAGDANDSTIKDCYYASFLLAQGLPFGGGDGAFTTENLQSYDGPAPFTKDDLRKEAEDENKTFTDLYFQIGVDSSEHSQMKFSIAFSMNGLNKLRNIEDLDILSNIDNLINRVSAKQTEYGACQNRLESALEEISTHYENLASSRSTLRDADIAKVSSEYIRQQILQQASATLMSTANQSPSIALQLL